MVSVLELIALFILVTTLLAVATRGREIRVFGKRIAFTIGGILLFFGREVHPKRAKPLGRGIGYAMLIVALIGIALFYVAFLPMLINFISRFIMFAIGASEARPQPPIVPAPLLFQYHSIITYILVAIGIGIVVHELAHAFVALREGIALRSWGIGILFLFPVAFVELDEDSYKRASPLSKAKIVSAGIFANAIVTVIALALLFGLNTALTAMNTQPTVMIVDIDCSVCSYSYGGTCPAQRAGLVAGDLIAYINGTKINTVEDIAQILQRVSVNSTLEMKVCSSTGRCRDVDIVLNAYRIVNGRTIPCLGVRITNTLAIPSGEGLSRPTILALIQQLLLYLHYIFIINFSLYVLNAIPLIITDGSKLLEALAERIAFLRRVVSIKVFDLINVSVLGISIALATYLLLSG